jgi:hypothetical protein
VRVFFLKQPRHAIFFEKQRYCAFLKKKKHHCAFFFFRSSVVTRFPRKAASLRELACCCCYENTREPQAPWTLHAAERKIKKEGEFEKERKSKNRGEGGRR